MLSTLKKVSYRNDINKAISILLNRNVCGRRTLSQLKYNEMERSAIRAIYVNVPCNIRHFHLSCNRNEKKPDQDPKQPPRQDNSDNNNNSSNNNNNDKDKENGEKVMSLLTKAVIWFVTIYSFITFLSFLTSRTQPNGSTRYVSWNEFVHHMLAAGEVKEIIIRPDLEMVSIILYEGAVIKGRKAPSSIYYMALADATKFEEKLRNVEKQLGIVEGVPIIYDRQSDITGRIFVLLFLCTLLLYIVPRLRRMKGPINMDTFTQMGKAKYTLIDPFHGGRGVYFKDVAGLQEAKQEVKEFVDYLKHPDKYQRLGAKVPKGALLLGPPGCGKTLLAKAVATESEVPFLSMNGSEFIEMIGGLGAARVRNLFQEGKRKAPCIIYIDEIDAIGRQRSGTNDASQGSSGESEQTLNQLLVEMDGMASKAGVLMLASTNRADILDKALLRPGRFDRHILIDLPSLQEREEIFVKHLSSIKLDVGSKGYSKTLAKLTPGFSGADIANVCNEAALHAARNLQKEVCGQNLEYAVERVVGGTEKRSHALSAVERKIVAYHESGHALVGWLLPKADVLLKVTIVPRTTLALGFAQYTPKEQQLFSQEELFDKMCMALGGRAAEEIIFNEITSGAQNDLEKVTKLAYSQIKKFGMNKKLGPMYIVDDDDSFSKPYSKALESIIDVEARELVASSYAKAKSLLMENTDKLKKIAEALMEKETLNYEQVVELIGPPPFAESRKLIEPVVSEKIVENLSKDS